MSRGTRRDHVIAWLRRAIAIASRARRVLWRTWGALAIGLGAGFGPQIAPPPPPPPAVEQVVEDGEAMEKA
jgi:hypothetical protein